MQAPDARLQRHGRPRGVAVAPRADRETEGEGQHERERDRVLERQRLRAPPAVDERPRRLSGLASEPRVACARPAEHQHGARGPDRRGEESDRPVGRDEPQPQAAQPPQRASREPVQDRDDHGGNGENLQQEQQQVGEGTQRLGTVSQHGPRGGAQDEGQHEALGDRGGREESSRAAHRSPTGWRSGERMASCESSPMPGGCPSTPPTAASGCCGCSSGRQGRGAARYLAHQADAVAGIVHLEEARALDPAVGLVDHHQQPSVEGPEQHRVPAVVVEERLLLLDPGARERAARRSRDARRVLSGTVARPQHHELPRLRPVEPGAVGDVRVVALALEQLAEVAAAAHPVGLRGMEELPRRPDRRGEVVGEPHEVHAAVRDLDPLVGEDHVGHAVLDPQRAVERHPVGRRLGAVARAGGTVPRHGPPRRSRCRASGSAVVPPAWAGCPSRSGSRRGSTGPCSGAPPGPRPSRAPNGPAAPRAPSGAPPTSRGPCWRRRPPA